MGRRTDGGEGGMRAEGRVGLGRELGAGWAAVLEGVVGWLVGGMFIFGLFAAAGASDVIERPMWLDEALMYRLVTDPSGGHMMGALQGGCDGNPPTWYWVLRGVLGVTAAVTGGVSKFDVRMVSLACVAGAGAVFYCGMKRAVGRAAAGVGAVALWVHPVVVAQAVEGRVYGPMLLFGVGLAVAIGDGRMGRGRMACAAVCAATLCTVHYFGVIVWGLVVAGRLAAERRGWERLWVVLAGPVGLAMCLPVMVGQRRALGWASWIDPLSVNTARRFLGEVWPVGLILVMAGSAVVARARRGKEEGVREWGVVGGMVGMGFMPAVLLLMSVAGMGGHLGRYGIVAGAGLGAIIAALVARAGKWAAVATCVVMIGWGVWQTKWWAVVPRSAHWRMLKVAEVCEKEAGAAIVSPSLLDVEGLRYLDEERFGRRVWFLEAGGKIQERVYGFNARLAGNLGEWYSDFRAVTVEESGGMGRFVYVPVGGADDPDRVFGGQGWKWEKAGEFAYLVERVR